MKAKEFDKKFDSGESIVQYLELERTARPGQDQRRVNVDFPSWMVSQLDREAMDLVREYCRLFEKEDLLDEWLKRLD